jgi:hypothetical protein
MPEQGPTESSGDLLASYGGGLRFSIPVNKEHVTPIQLNGGLQPLLGFL